MERMPGPEIEGACQPAQRCDQEMEGSEVMARKTEMPEDVRRMTARSRELYRMRSEKGKGALRRRQS